ncbi:hypothetical protein BDP55DRAFT_734738 [Colletotrichum godetiae]|uniref:Uncharacterized protein n=1 Tax=Colletotrichum godetiae TaxID=1209918 RepID=A0AAJ0AAV8_9PEZI|nr:uncharacterized protein BDP55DRAFT_734738 [Colletotrichum godetiae]KAK1657655.1 hypothetical protein BDP55DRAFT_734738 [Colletotrichum godetiae]
MWDQASGRRLRVRRRASARLLAFAGTLESTIDAHAALWGAAKVNQDREERVESLLCNLAKAFQEAILVGDHRLAEAKRLTKARLEGNREGSRSHAYVYVREWGIRLDEHDDDVLTADGLTDVTHKIRGIEATGSMLCIQAQETSKELRWRRSASADLEKGLSGQRATLGILIKKNEAGEADEDGGDPIGIERELLRLAERFTGGLEQAYFE